MLKFKFLFIASAALCTASALAAEPSAIRNGDSACHAQLATIRTAFPQALQTRGEHGVVELKATIDKDGRATTAQVTQSSGFASLDKAAADSVIRSWRFDVSHCAAAELPRDAALAVRFEPAPQYTVSGTVNRHRMTKATAPDRCDVAFDNSGNAIISCATETAANRSAEASLADRIDTARATHRE